METKPQPVRIWRIVVVLVGVLALLLAYYWVHKLTGTPDQPAEDIALALVFGGALLDVLTVIALFAIAGGIGRRALSRLDLALTRPERIAIEGALGLGVISL